MFSSIMNIERSLFNFVLINLSLSPSSLEMPVIIYLFKIIPENIVSFLTIFLLHSQFSYTLAIFRHKGLQLTNGIYDLETLAGATNLQSRKYYGNDSPELTDKGYSLQEQR